jgi:CRISPR type III-B/RAMP module RAMP protein Cmr6
MSQIPITKDYARAVGEWCEKVENRSLLLDKFAFPKKWGAIDEKKDDASRWSLMRIASNGSTLLNMAAKDCERKADGRSVTSENAQRYRDAAQHCRKLADIKIANLSKTQKKHTSRFLELLRAAYSENRLNIVNARLEGRLAINLAEGLIQNAGINLDRIFGLPLIPGSAIKGVARHAALAELAERKDAATLEKFVRVFGSAASDYKTGDLSPYHLLLPQTQLPKDDKGNTTKDIMGAVSFIQSTPINDAQIVVDITNVHYPDYYNGKEPAAKSEKPMPNTFPAVERGVEFAFPIVLNGLDLDPALLEAAGKWLLQALTQSGLGAKTAAGYGWFSVLETPQEVSTVGATMEEEASENEAELLAKFKAMPDDLFRGELNRFRGGLPSGVTTQYARILRDYAKAERAGLLTGKAQQAISKLEELK